MLQELNREIERLDIVSRCMSHIKSILVGIDKFQKGSNAEANYLAEHYEALGWNIDEIKTLMRGG